jgi:hypothetical protein
MPQMPSIHSLSDFFAYAILPPNINTARQFPTGNVHAIQEVEVEKCQKKPVTSHVLSSPTEPNTYAMLQIYVTPCCRENSKLPYADDK